MINQDARRKLRLPLGTRERKSEEEAREFGHGEGRITSFVGRELAEGIFKSAVRVRATIAEAFQLLAKCREKTSRRFSSVLKRLDGEILDGEETFYSIPMTLNIPI